MSKKIKLSATRISMFLQCKQKYYFNYYEKLPKVPNPVFKLGTACHETLEYAGRIFMDKGKLTKKDIDNIMDEYIKISVKEGIQELAIHKEGAELIKKRLKDFEIGRKILTLEETFGFKDDLKTENGVYLTGAMDKVVEVDDDTLLVVDYKTSKTAPTAEQLKTDIQLSIYDVVANMLFPQYKRIILSLDMLRSDLLYTYRTTEERESFLKYLEAINTAMYAFTKKDAKPEINQFCAWCDFKDYCSAYQKACEKTDGKFGVTTKYSDSELVTEWNRVRSNKKILEGRDRELSMLVMEKIKEFGDNIKTDDSELYIRQNSKTYYDVDTVFECIPIDMLKKMVNLKNKEIEKYMDINPTIKEKIRDSARINYISPFIASRKLKK